MVFKIICVLMLWTKVASALEGLNQRGRDLPLCITNPFMQNETHTQQIRFLTRKSEVPSNACTVIIYMFDQ